MAYEEARFWSKVDVREQSRCWEWQAASDGHGYGQFSYDGQQMRSNRVAWLLEHGDPGEQMVLHECHNRACVNPEHLYLGDNKQNMKDAAEQGNLGKGRSPGESNAKAKLTEDDVRKIRMKYEDGMTQADLADEFPVSRPNIGKIVRREAWTHVE